MLSRGGSAVVLQRNADRSRSLLHAVGALTGVALLGFGQWRGAWAFTLVGLVVVIAVVTDWWLRRRSVTVRVTIDAAGNVRQEVITLGDQ